MTKNLMLLKFCLSAHSSEKQRKKNNQRIYYRQQHNYEWQRNNQTETGKQNAPAADGYWNNRQTDN